MRKSQPVFVVEYKGGRRQKQVPKKSIWGDVDFALLISEIEQDRPPATSANVICAAADDHKAVKQEVSEKHLVQPEAEAERRPTLVGAKSLLARNKADNPGGRVLEPECRPSKEIAASPAPHSFYELESNAAACAGDTYPGRVSVFEDVEGPAFPIESISRKQLAKLDAENAELKRLFKQRLLDQNKRLKEMLERFPK
ncbi:hypothetical protein C8J34_1113 [Rhizobium sp. PP-F2F-G36]|nr:hypothetical protein C8J34_1113 [Rhizobium sp. PP-F2F-G36]